MKEQFHGIFWHSLKKCAGSKILELNLFWRWFAKRIEFLVEVKNTNIQIVKVKPRGIEVYDIEGWSYEMRKCHKFVNFSILKMMKMSFLWRIEYFYQVNKKINKKNLCQAQKNVNEHENIEFLSIENFHRYWNFSFPFIGSEISWFLLIDKKYF